MEVQRGRFTADIDGDFVVFLIGMRFNHPLRIRKWWPVASAMPRMLKVLSQHPELGCLGFQQWFGRTTILVQYWRDFDSLDRVRQGQRPTAPGAVAAVQPRGQGLRRRRDLARDVQDPGRRVRGRLRQYAGLRPRGSCQAFAHRPEGQHRSRPHRCQRDGRAGSRAVLKPAAR